MTQTRTPVDPKGRLPVTGQLQGTNVAPPPPPPLFNRPVLRQGKRSMHSVPGNKPPKGSTSQAFFYIYNIYVMVESLIWSNFKFYR